MLCTRQKTKVVDYWDGRTCHWKVGPCRVGYYRVYSPDKTYSIDVPNDQICDGYIGNGKFRLRPKNAPAATSGSNSLFADIVGEMAGAFIEGAVSGTVDGLTQSAVDAALKRTVGKHRKPLKYPNYRSETKQNNTAKPNTNGIRTPVSHSSCRGTGICHICKGRKIVGADMTCTGCGGSGICRACGGRGYTN